MTHFSSCHFPCFKLTFDLLPYSFTSFLTASFKLVNGPLCCSLCHSLDTHKQTHRRNKKTHHRGLIMHICRCILSQGQGHCSVGGCVCGSGCVCMLSAYNLHERQCSAEALVVCWTHIVPLISLKSKAPFYVCLAV